MRRQVFVYDSVIICGILAGIIMAVLCVFASYAEPLKGLPVGPGLYNAFEKMTIFEDTTGAISAQRILQPKYQELFHPTNKNSLNVGWTRSAYWFRLQLDCAELASQENAKPLRWNLLLGWPYFSHLEVYKFENDTLLPIVSADQKHSLWEANTHQDRILPICDQSQGSETYYIHAASDRSFFFAPRLCSEEACIDSILSYWIIFGGTLGVIVAMVIYNLFLFAYLKDVSYIWYVFYHMCVIIYLVLKQWLPIDVPFQNFLIPVIFNIGIAAASMFARHFFELWKRNKYINATSIAVTVLAILLAICGPFISRLLHQLFSAALGIVCIGVNLVAAIHCLRKGLASAQFYLFAWIVTGTLAVIYAFSALGLLSFKYYQSLSYGIAMEALIMSLALAYRIRVMRITQEEAEAANQAKVSFLAKVSHDIRTPLNAIIGFTNVALRQPNLSQVRNFLEKIRTAANSQLGLVNDILDFSKIEIGKLEIERKPFDLNNFLQEMADVAAKSAIANNNDLIFVTNKNIPTHYFGDPGRLGQALGNLINNSLKFTKNGHVVVRVEHRSCPVQNEEGKPLVSLTFTVSDNGIGIEASKLPILFQSFTQADKYIANIYGGSGLGLSICKGLVEAMGGQVWAKSELHQGATFGFTVPLQNNSSLKPIHLTMPLLGLKALVVSWANPVSAITAEIMESFGFNTDRAKYSTHAVQLALIQDEPYALAIVDDTALEEEPGIVNKIRKACPPETEVLVLTSLDQYDAISLRHNLSGTRLYAAKPLTPLALYRAIMDALGQKEAVQATEELSEDEVAARNILKGKKILVVEDNQFNQEVARLILNEVGVEVSVAENGEVALNDLLSQSPAHYDAVIMDMVMPVMGGVEAATQIRKYQSFQRLPIVAMTANAMKGDSEVCLQAGMNAHISKPIDTRELLITLARCIEEQAEMPTSNNDG